MKTITSRQRKDIKVIGKFVEVYCSAKHIRSDLISVTLPGDVGVCKVCAECSTFIEYAVSKRLRCPLEENKPTCKNCHIHCYDKLHREKIREIMSYSGRRLMMAGRLDYIWHYFF